MKELGIISFVIAGINFLVTMYFVIKKEEITTIKFRLAYGSILILSCGLAALLFELNLNYYAEGVMIFGFILYSLTSLRLGFKTKNQSN